MQLDGSLTASWSGSSRSAERLANATFIRRIQDFTLFTFRSKFINVFWYALIVHCHFPKKDYHLSKLKKGHHSMNEIRYPSGHSGRHSTIDKSALLKHEAFPPPLGSSNIINMVGVKIKRWKYTRWHHWSDGSRWQTQPRTGSAVR